MTQLRRRSGRTVIATITGAAGVALLAAAGVSAGTGSAHRAAVANFGTVATQPFTTPTGAQQESTGSRTPGARTVAPLGSARVRSSLRDSAVRDSASAHPAAHRPPAATDLTPPGVPVRLRLPSLHVTASIDPVVSADDELAVPDDPARLGWWAGGVLPGAARGSVLIDGHVDSAATGPGALFRLIDLRAGDVTTLDTATGHSVSYRVTARRSYPKTHGLPAGLLSRTGPAQLLLVTCGGAFDRAARSYDDNIVVIARPI